jgi:hypothetical protein
VCAYSAERYKENRGGCQEPGRRESGKLVLNGAEFQEGKMEKSWRWLVTMAT